MIKRTKEYMTVLELNRNISKEDLRILSKEINAAFNNRAGRVKNCSMDPYTFAFQGDESDWGCLNLGDDEIAKIKSLKGKIKSWTWEEDNPFESGDTLKIYRKHGYDI